MFIEDEVAETVHVLEFVCRYHEYNGATMYEAAGCITAKVGDLDIILHRDGANRVSRSVKTGRYSESRDVVSVPLPELRQMIRKEYAYSVASQLYRIDKAQETIIF